VAAPAANTTPETSAFGRDLHAPSPAPATGHDAHGATQHGAGDANQPQAPAHGDSKINLADPSATQADRHLSATPTALALLPMTFESSGQALPTSDDGIGITHGASLSAWPRQQDHSFASERRERQTITFNRPGPVLIYCTTFCGPGHDAMKARILVA